MYTYILNLMDQKKYFTCIGFEGQDGDRWRADVNAVMNLLFA
jgi:hypothetical protein